MGSRNDWLERLEYPSVRLVAWNANYNNHPRSLEDSASLVAHLNPDVLVLSETVAPAEANPLGAQWVPGTVPGLAVIAGRDFSIIPHRENDGAPLCAGGFFIHGRVEFDLLAAWPVMTTKFPSYPSVLTAILDRYEEFLRSAKIIMAGDLNSSTRVRGQEKSHPRLVDRLQSLGLSSVYHHLTGEVHGKEATPTFLYRHNPAQPFHIDYCLVPEPLLPSSSLEILTDTRWAELSDHFPLVLDLDDEALALQP